MALRLHIGLNARRANAESWGDLGYARCLAAAFERIGHDCTLFFRDERPQLSGRDEVVLRIVGPHLDDPVPGVPNLLWIISPPNHAALAHLARYQAVFIASATLAARCSALGQEARFLPQATDPALFNPEARGGYPVDLQVSFVGNLAPRVPRSAVLAAIAQGFDVHIWGQGWEGAVPQRHIRSERLEIDGLAQVYARSAVVLNSHMSNMAELGFMSNRSFDALACGAQVLSDRVQGFADESLSALVQVDAPADVGPALSALLSAQPDRRHIAGLMRSRFSFAARARILADAAQQLLALGMRAEPAFAPRPAHPLRGDVLRLELTDCPETDAPDLAAWLDGLMQQHRLEVTLHLTDPSTTPEGMSVEMAMQRAAFAVLRIGAVMARRSSFAALNVRAAPSEARSGVIHAAMIDHREAQAAALAPDAPATLAVLERVCARARRLLDCADDMLLDLAAPDTLLDPVQARIRLLGNRPFYPHTPEGFSRDRQKRHLRLWPRNSGVRIDRPIGVFLHLYYADLAACFRDRLQALDLPHRLYVSTDSDDKAAQIAAVLPSAKVRVVANRGRDVHGKLCGFADAHAGHDLVLHLHGKKSPHSGGLDQWLDHCLTCLLPSREEVLRIVSLFQSIPDLGMVAPLTFRSVLAAAHWGDNLDIARELVARLPAPCALPADADLEFPVGSMFWARRLVLQPLLGLGLNSGHFPPETGQVDATPAHAIERLFGVLCQASGHRMIRVAPASSTQHKSRQIAARRNEDVRKALQEGQFQQ
ncbi:rhamnan synthesis F family protein [Pseudotabrizicola algicola]|uniref:Glycosyl transferase n=1 Tax=Pseudotabrizicola algicola TaxID=2709381 RepID=A0A6B3RP43_9RHOB|nr:rhamnan synthesis F family protein [Pseudotabrizicola algicola]NEX44812.1 glycosyl transferase [Pseudotabrizicola algicola]